MVKARITLALLAVLSITACDLVPSPPGRIKGTVRYNSQPISGASLQASFYGKDSIANWISGRPSNQYSSKEDGTYILDNLHPGEFIVTVDAYVGGKNVHLERQATVRSGIDTNAVDFELSQATASL